MQNIEVLQIFSLCFGLITIATDARHTKLGTKIKINVTSITLFKKYYFQKNHKHSDYWKLMSHKKLSGHRTCN
jgi:hypothetical protein